MKRFGLFISAVLFCLSVLPAYAVEQDVYALPEPYLGLEKAYLKAYPDLQAIMDAMIANSKVRLKSPDQDILHNRVCAALVYQMAVSDKQPKRLHRLGPAGTLLHNITKDAADFILTDPARLKEVSDMIDRLKKNGYFKKSPDFYTDPSVFSQKVLGGSLALIHHLTGAVTAAKIMENAGKFNKKDLRDVQAAIVTHSTGYWYFRDSADEALKQKDAWKNVYPEPESDLDKYIHDADLISQFERASVSPDGSKWRQLAAKRWGATNAKEEGHVVYYVFSRLFGEARTKSGAALAGKEWDAIKPDLLRLMDLAPDQDPLKVLGVPAFWKK